MADLKAHQHDPEQKLKHDSSDPEDAYHQERLDSESSMKKPDQNAEDGAPTKWTFRRVVAVISLCLVYVGQWPPVT